MPWCEDCSKFWNPNTIPPDGTCPACGRVIGEPPDTSVPWHFWLLLGALVLYLGWRLVQGVDWLLANGYAAGGAALAVVSLAITGWITMRWWRGRGAE